MRLWAYLFGALLVLATLQGAFATLTTDLVAYYKFDTDTANSLALYDLTNVGADVTTSGIINGSYKYVTANTDYMHQATLLDTGGALSVSFWFNLTSTFDAAETVSQFLVSKNNVDNNDRLNIQLDAATGEMNIYTEGSNDGGTTLTSVQNSWTANTWYHVVLVWNTSHRILYINNVSVASEVSAKATLGAGTADNFALGYYPVSTSLYLGGDMDEFGLWSNGLNESEVALLYDSGAGCSYPFASCGVAPPPAPAGVAYYYDMYVEDLYNDSNLAGVNVTFAVGCDNLTDANGLARVTNQTTGCAALGGALSDVNLSLSLYTWNQTSYAIPLNGSDNGTGYQALYNLSVLKIISGDAVNKPYNITTIGGKTYENGSLVYLLNGSNNVTFSKNTINRTFYNLTKEINAANASATNVTNISGAYDLIVGVRVRDANLNLIVENGTFNISLNYTYNKFVTNYTIAYTNQSLNFTLLRNLTYLFHADPLTYAQNNLSLWINGSDPDYYYPLNLTLYRERTFNLSFLDEITRALITNTTFELELISDILALNYSVNDSQEALELLTPAAYTLRWRSSKHPERDYYETISSESFFTIRLYSLTTGNSTDTLVKVINTQGQTIENATVSLLRYYVACNCYEVVEMAKTGFNGVAYMTSQEVEGHYKWIVEYAGITRFLSTSPENLIADTGTGQITRTITIDLGTNYYESFVGLTDIASTVTYNAGTSTLSFIWNDGAGLVTEGCLIARTIENSRYVTAGKNCANGTSGNVLLTLTNTNTTSYRWSAYVNTDTAYSDHTLHNGFLTPSATFTTFGTLAAFGSLFVIVAGAAIFSFSAIAVVLFVGFALSALIILQQFTQAIILPFSLELLTGFIALTVGISIYLLRK